MTLFINGLGLRRRDGVRLVAPLTLTLHPGERIALLGESGSGKSLLAQAIFGVLPAGVIHTEGSLEAFGVPLDRPGSAQDRVRGSCLSWVPQDPLEALNPILGIGDQISLLPWVHRRESRRVALDRLAPLLARLQLPQTAAFLGRLPGELSGGQRQRVALAVALSCDPELMVLDEPTTALDPPLQTEYLSFLSELQASRGLGWLWITHSPAVAQAVADRVVVLYGGEIVEAGPAQRVLQTPRHPYTQRLLLASRGEPTQEAGFLEAPERRPSGCPFTPRCPEATQECGQAIPWRGAPEDGIRCLAR